MIYFQKSQPAPDILMTEKEKKSGSYNQASVIERLEKDFKNKCYICEQKEPTSLNIEHFKPHKDNRDLKFDWNNLFFACAHCNNVKLAGFDNLLNCTITTDHVEQVIHHYCDPFPKEKAVFNILSPSLKADQTKALLEKCYNGEHTPQKKLESSNLRKLLIKEIQLFLSDIDNYNQYKKPLMLTKIKNHLSTESAFTAFKRWHIRDNDMLKQEFEPLLSDNNIELNAQ